MRAGRGNRWLLVVSLVSLSIGMGLVGLWVQRTARSSAAAATAKARRTVAGAVERSERALNDTRAARAQRRQVVAGSVAAAGGRLARAVAPWQTDLDAALSRRFTELVQGDRFEDAGAMLRAWQPRDDDAPALLARIDYWIGVEQLERAREAAWAGAERFEDTRSGFIRRWYRTFQADPAFWAPTARTIAPGPDLTGIRRFDVATSVLLRFDREGHTWAVLKPMQTNRFTNYRGEIAAYRLCPLIHCDFSIPHNAEVRIGEDDLMSLMRLPDLAAVRAIQRNESLPIWFEEGGERWLYGTLKAWVPGFTRFPIEDVEVWRPLLDGTYTARELERLSLQEALSPLAEADPEWWLGFSRRADEVTAFELAHQLSDLHVFDALINNWDRYSSAYPASNCQWDHGQLVSIDNGASFMTRAEWEGREVELRLRRVRRFSRRTIDAIRWMQSDPLFELLFPPNPHISGEAERWQAFLDRRRFVLEHVDQLIERYGSERVLIFP